MCPESSPARLRIVLAQKAADVGLKRFDIIHDNSRSMIPDQVDQCVGLQASICNAVI